MRPQRWQKGTEAIHMCWGGGPGERMFGLQNILEISAQAQINPFVCIHRDHEEEPPDPCMHKLHPMAYCTSTKT